MDKWKMEDQLKKKLGTNMKEGLDNYYVVARNSVVRNQEMLDKSEETDKEREAMIKNVMKDRKHAKTK